MPEQQASYRSIMKATSLFGGVQVFNIVIQIIRSKAIAILLGPAGMGILGLFNATISIISNLTNFGLGISAVKDIAAAKSGGDDRKVSKVVTAFRHLVWVTGILGLLLTIILSPWLSQLTFGSKKYTIAFIWLSITLLFTQLSSGQLVILQGLRKLKLLARSSVLGSSLGLIIAIPLYYFLRIDGIVPSIVSGSIISFLISWFYSKKIRINPIKISLKQSFDEGKNMIRMGFMISLSGLLTMGSSYIVQIFIGRIDDVGQVGLYIAGFAIINNYVGLVFNAMATDYYPRISAVANNNELCKQAINQQAEIAILILAPILIGFLIFINWAIILLYSKQFLGINGMIYWAVLGIFFKALSWSIAFVFLAKGVGKLFFWNELMANIYMLGLNILGYFHYGLTGLGISFAIAYFLYFIQVFLISKKKFNFLFEIDLVKIFIVQFSFTLLAFLCINYLKNPYLYIFGIVLIITSICYSFKELDKRMNLIEIIKNLK